MQLRLYKFKKKYVRKDGTVAIGPNRQWKWIKTKAPPRKQRPHGQSKTIYSKRFGYLNNYKWKELQMLKCPSGHTVPQCMNILRRLWFGYQVGLNEANIKKMEKYARALQAVQEDLGVKTASFPHLGIYGDLLVYYDHSSKSDTNKIKTEIDHSELKAKQEIEELKEKLPDTYVPPLIEPDTEKGEELVTIADEIPAPQPQPKQRYRVKHENRMHLGRKRDEEWVCENCDEIVPLNKNHICRRKEANEDVITMTDDIPFEPSQEN